MRTVTDFVFLFFFLLLTGCSSVQSRVNEFSSEFETYPEALQQKIRKGEIATDFTQTMVYIAKGNPSKVAQSQEGSDEIVLWYYQHPRVVALPGASNDSLSSPFGYPNFGQGPLQPTGVIQTSTDLIIKFKNNRVEEWVDLVGPR